MHDHLKSASPVSKGEETLEKPTISKSFKIFKIYLL